MSDPPVPTHPGDDDPADELGSLARELARGYAELVESHRRAWGVGAAEAEAKAREHGEWAVAAARADPPDQVTWWTLSTAMERDPEAARLAWERVKVEAKKELHTGHRSAAALEWGGKPWDRARYLALREAFAADWKPRGAIESALLDVLAQSFSAYLKWTERATTQAEAEAQTEDAKLKRDGYWQPPRVMTGEYMAWCTDQAERAHRRFLATLKALHDLRRLPAVFVAGAGQVNVGAQQVNVAAPAHGEGEADP